MYRENEKYRMKYQLWRYLIVILLPYFAYISLLNFYIEKSNVSNANEFSNVLRTFKKIYFIFK